MSKKAESERDGERRAWSYEPSDTAAAAMKSPLFKPDVEYGTSFDVS